VLFEHDRHEPLDTSPWSDVQAQGAIERITQGISREFTADGLWPRHPLDLPEVGEPFFRDLYIGAAGAMWGLDFLHRAGASVPPPDFASARVGLVEPNRRNLRGLGLGTASLLISDAGILLVDWKASAADSAAAELARAVSENHANPVLELMWGAPGTMIAALTMHEWTGDDAWSDLFRSSALALRESLEFDSELGVSLWTQHLYGARSRLLGAVHGFAGNVFPIIRGRNLLSAQEWDWWRGQIVRTAWPTCPTRNSMSC
jgi:hypothetical protein